MGKKVKRILAAILAASVSVSTIHAEVVVNTKNSQTDTEMFESVSENDKKIAWDNVTTEKIYEKKIIKSHLSLWNTGKEDTMPM